MSTNKEKLTIREQIMMHLLMLMMTVVNPTSYTHELSKPFDEIKKLIKIDG